MPSDWLATPWPSPLHLPTRPLYLILYACAIFLKLHLTTTGIGGKQSRSCKPDAGIPTVGRIRCLFYRPEEGKKCTILHPSSSFGCVRNVICDIRWSGMKINKETTPQNLAAPLHLTYVPGENPGVYVGVHACVYVCIYVWCMYVCTLSATSITFFATASTTSLPRQGNWS